MHDMEPEPNNLSLINHSLHRIMRVCVLVLLGLLGVHAASWPSIPTSYTATVSANFHNSQPGNYYTLVLFLYCFRKLKKNAKMHCPIDSFPMLFN
jgi:hypothetical protein